VRCWSTDFWSSSRRSDSPFTPLILLGVRRRQLVARRARRVRLVAQDRQRLEIGLEQHVEEMAAADQVNDAGRPEQEAHVPFAPQPVAGPPAWAATPAWLCRAAPASCASSPPPPKTGGGHAQPGLGGAQPAATRARSGARGRPASRGPTPPCPPGSSAARALVLQPLLDLRQRLRESGGGDPARSCLEEPRGPRSSFRRSRPARRRRGWPRRARARDAAR